MTFLPNKSAEENFRAAYERLKIGKPLLLPMGTPVTQGNVAREAGCDRTALKKSRFPELVAEIQRAVSENTGGRPESERQKLLKQRQRNRSARDKIANLKNQRDALAGCLNEANAQIAILSRRLADSESRCNALQARNEPISIAAAKPKSRPRPVDMETQKLPQK